AMTPGSASLTCASDRSRRTWRRTRAGGAAPSIDVRRVTSAMPSASASASASEEIFGWMKTIGGFRRTRYRGLARTQLAGYLVATAYNLVRLVRLAASAAPA